MVLHGSSSLCRSIQCLYRSSVSLLSRRCILRDMPACPRSIQSHRLHSSSYRIAVTPIRSGFQSSKSVTFSLRKGLFKYKCPNSGRIFNVPVRSLFDKSEVIKDVVLYRNTGVSFFRLVGAFAASQLLFWSYMTYTSYESMRDAHMMEVVKYGPEGAPPELKNWRSWSGIHLTLSSNKWRYGLTTLCILAGCGIFAGSYMYSRRSISLLVLLRGGNRVTVETFGLFGLRSSFTVPVSRLSCQHARQAVDSQLPMKVKGHSFHYILDKQGKFLNGRLFDHTAGMRRVFT